MVNKKNESEFSDEFVIRFMGNSDLIKAKTIVNSYNEISNILRKTNHFIDPESEIDIHIIAMEDGSTVLINKIKENNKQKVKKSMKFTNKIKFLLKFLSSILVVSPDDIDDVSGNIEIDGEIITTNVIILPVSEGIKINKDIKFNVSNLYKCLSEDNGIAGLEISNNKNGDILVKIPRSKFW